MALDLRYLEMAFTDVYFSPSTLRSWVSIAELKEIYGGDVQHFLLGCKLMKASGKASGMPRVSRRMRLDPTDRVRLRDAIFYTDLHKAIYARAFDKTLSLVEGGPRALRKGRLHITGHNDPLLYPKWEGEPSQPHADYERDVRSCVGDNRDQAFEDFCALYVVEVASEESVSGNPRPNLVLHAGVGKHGVERRLLTLPDTYEGYGGLRLMWILPVDVSWATEAETLLFKLLDAVALGGTMSQVFAEGHHEEATYGVCHLQLIRCCCWLVAAAFSIGKPVVPLHPLTPFAASRAEEELVRTCPPPPVTRQICCVEGCQTAAQSSKLCYAHGGGKRCKVPGCKKQARTNNLCMGHKDLA